MKVEKISQTLQKVLTARGLSGRLGIYRVIGRWDSVVGTVIARHAQPHSIRGKKLTVQVDSPVWMQQLALLKPDLIEKVNKGLGPETVKEIKLTLGTVEGRPIRKEKAAPLPPLSEEERDLIDRYTDDIREPDIRASLRRLMETDLRNKRRSGRSSSRGREAGSRRRAAM